MVAGVCLNYQHIRRKTEAGESEMIHNVNTLAINADDVNYINRTRKVEEKSYKLSFDLHI